MNIACAVEVHARVNLGPEKNSFDTAGQRRWPGPETGRIVAATRQDGLPIGTEDTGQHRSLVAHRGAESLSTGGIPKARGPITTASHDSAAVGAKCSRK